MSQETTSSGDFVEFVRGIRLEEESFFKNPLISEDAGKNRESIVEFDGNERIRRKLELLSVEELEAFYLDLGSGVEEGQYVDTDLWTSCTFLSEQLTSRAMQVVDRDIMPGFYEEGAYLYSNSFRERRSSDGLIYPMVNGSYVELEIYVPDASVERFEEVIAKNKENEGLEFAEYRGNYLIQMSLSYLSKELGNKEAEEVVSEGQNTVIRDTREALSPVVS